MDAMGVAFLLRITKMQAHSQLSVFPDNRRFVMRWVWILSGVIMLMVWPGMYFVPFQRSLHRQEGKCTFVILQEKSPERLTSAIEERQAEGWELVRMHETTRDPFGTWYSAEIRKVDY
jgi:hypothetical protein